MKNLLLGFAVLGTVGCHPQKAYRLSLSTTAPTVAKAEPCDFRVVNLPPQGPFEEIATLTPIELPAQSPTDFKAIVHKDVCRVGGAVVVTEVNGYGRYVRGTVLRELPEHTTAAD